MTEQHKYYTILGKEQYTDEKGFPRLESETMYTYAKCSLSQKPKHIVSNTNLGVDKNSYKYYIALNSKKEAYNPTDPYQPKGSFVDTICRSSSKLTQVNQYIFDKYVQFLKTGNDGWIKEINRDLR